MRIFNAFQIVVLFAIMPFLIAWLPTQEFPCSKALYYVAFVVYLIGFILTCAAWVRLLEETK